MIYFGYCTLLAEAEMARLCPAAKPLGVATLRGYELCFSAFQGQPEAGSCDIAVKERHLMWGLLFEMVPSEYDALDIMAGVDKGHLARIEITVHTPEGQSLAVTTYQNPTPAGPHYPTAAYTAPILAGAQALNLPKSYQDELKTIIQAAQQKSA